MFQLGGSSLLHDDDRGTIGFLVVDGFGVVWLSQSNEPVQVCARNIEAAGRQGFVAVIFTHGMFGQLHLVIAQLTLKGAG